MTFTFEDCAKDTQGTVYDEGTLQGIRYLVMRGPISVNAYLGIPDNHPLAGKSYDDIDIEVHGGLTFADYGNGEEWPKGYYWFGWDYAHYMDKTFYHLTNPDWILLGNEIGWTPDMILAEVKQAIPKLAKMVEETK